MAKEEPHEPAAPIENQKRPDISPRSFQSRLAEWSEQCLRFQSSGETWVPTKPCCPASPFLGLEACLWQGCKKHEPTACVQLLSMEELLELYDFFRENPSFEDQPEAASGSEPQLDVRPWMRDLPAPVWAEGFRLEKGMLKLSATSCAVVEPRPGGQAPKRQRAGRWHVQPRDTASKKRGEEAEAQKLKRKPVTPRAKAQELAKESKRKKAPLSAVRGVDFIRRDSIWRVYMYNPSTQKQVYGGSFKVQREAEAKARKLAKELGLRTTRKLGGILCSILWHRGGWRVRFRISGSKKQIEKTFKPADLSTDEVEKARKKAVAWRRQQEKQQLKQASKR
ncbi:unnamed protein product [Symbiodinium sp. CCMP2456]|nr:unnamed protein product [Symbiodinium sp. CCMP2456]